MALVALALFSLPAAAAGLLLLFLPGPRGPLQYMVAGSLATALGFEHLPLPWDSDDPLELPRIYLLGVWFSILLALGVTSLYAFQVTEESRKLSDALAATELVLAREQHLTQLDGLAAAAAHELGTPLSTIFLISRELEQSAQAPTDTAPAGDGSRW